MALRAKKPEAVVKRLKLFMFGAAGVGKTTAAIQFPNSYIIDCEKGTENYDTLIAQSGSVVFQTTDMREVIEEVRSLLTEKHNYRTLVIDPITPLYSDLLDRCEKQVGSDFGRHYGAANKEMKRLANLIMQLDMNVVITAHAKAEYGQNLAKLGYTFDGWKQLDYWFDLVIELGKKNKKRFAKVVKTRLQQFPDEDVFQWSYDAVCKRYDARMLEKEAQQIPLADPSRIREIKELVSMVRLPDGIVDKWFAKAGVDAWDDMPPDTLDRCIEYIRCRLPTTLTRGTGEVPAQEPKAAKTPAPVPPAPSASNGHAPPAHPELLDNARFIEEWQTILAGRGFSDVAAAALLGRKFKESEKFQALDDLGQSNREALLFAARRGDYDALRTELNQLAASPASASLGAPGLA